MATTRLRIWIFSSWLVLALGIVFFLFWKQEYQYMLPTPTPKELSIVKVGETVSVDSSLNKYPRLFLHFFNTDCPCSRFNIKDFRAMVNTYKGEVEFVAVLQTEDPKDIEEFKNKYELGIDLIIDPKGEIAASLGVYSTPQAVLIENGKLFYKGNYNRARYCVSRNTRFAEKALQALIRGEQAPVFPEVAFVAYGCELPSNHSSASTSIFNLFNF